jgi:hypothetical protein
VGTNQAPAASTERERFWRKLVVGQARSGVSIRVWCDRHGVSESSYYLWRRELTRRKEQRQGASSQLVAVEVAPPAVASLCDLEIELPGRILVRVGPGCNLDLLRQALALLRAGGLLLSELFGVTRAYQRPARMPGELPADSCSWCTGRLPYFWLLTPIGSRTSATSPRES